ncbi:MAG: alkaline phosphatase family protein [Egibacteraceae bacterium]
MVSRPFPKVVCIGLDGATFDVIDPLIAQGRLPTLAKLISSGVRARLASVVPPLSAPAWTSFMTGVNPGQHGVFHFRAMEESGVGERMVGSWAYRGRTIFDYASAAGLRVVSFRVPMTYPAWSVNGVMVSGFPTPDPRTTFSEPPEVGRRIGPLLKLSPARSMVASVEAQAENFSYYLERSTAALVQLLEAGDVELFCYVNSITDWVAHKFWRYSDPGAPGYEPYAYEGGTLVESFYEKSDASLGAILDAAPDDALVIILSDHGTGRRSELRFDTSAWLSDLGLLARAPRRQGRKAASLIVEWIKDVAPKKYWLWRHAPTAVRRTVGALGAQGDTVDWAASRAYRVRVDHHVEGVNVNLAGRGPHGWVPEAEFEAIRDQVVEAARELVDPATGAKVVEGAYRREELYRGDHAHLAPDVVLILNPTYEFGPSTDQRAFSRVAESRLRRSSATHRPDGILTITGPGTREGVDLGHASLLDVPATIMWALGMDVPQDMDGRVLTEAFDDSVTASHAVRRGAGRLQEAEAAGGYSAEEEEQLAAHLEELGYL